MYGQEDLFRKFLAAESHGYKTKSGDDTDRIPESKGNNVMYESLFNQKTKTPYD